MKQKTENIFRECFKKSFPNSLIIKLQVNSLAHQVTIADYFVQTVRNDIMVECKETKSKTFAVSRVTQETRLINFEEYFPRNKSFLFFYFPKIDKAYFIPIMIWINFRQQTIRKYLEPEDFDFYFKDFECKKFTNRKNDFIININ